MRSDNRGGLHLEADHLCLEQACVTLEEKIAQLFESLREGVYRYVMTIVKSSAIAEEVTQDTFIKLYAYTRGGGHVNHYRAWVYRTAHNLALNESTRKRVTSSDAVDWEWLSRARPDPAPNPEERALQQEKYTRLCSVLNELPGQQRQCILLRAEGFGYSEIAEILAVSKSTVGESLRRAMKKLKAKYDV